MRFTSLNKLLIFVLLAGCAAFGQSINLDTQVKGSRLPMWAVDSGSANAYAIATIGALGPSLRTGSRFAFIATHANTTASTLVVDGGSTIAIKKNVSVALVSGDIALNQVIEVTYDGTNFQLVGPGFIATTITVNGVTCTLGSSCTITAAPSGTAGGDLSGSYPNPTVAQVNGAAVPASAGLVGTNSSRQFVAVTTPLAVANGGTGTTTPSLVAGSNVTITGSWPNQTIASSGGGGGGGGSFFGLWNFTAPPSASWSWDNQGTSTIDSSFGYEYLTAAATTGTQLRIRYRTAPATPYIVDTALLHEVQGALAGSGNGNNSYCIGFRQSSTGKILAFELMNAGGWNAVVTIWTTSTSGNTDLKNFTGTAIENVFRNPSLIRMRDDGTSLYFDTSIDGNHWVNFYSEARGTHFSVGPDQVMFGALQFNSGGAVNIALVNWNVH